MDYSYFADFAASLALGQVVEKKIDKKKIESFQVVEGKELGDAPYIGLNPYDEADSIIFFGRKNDIQKVVNELLAWPLTILYGKSGVGKSSLLRAGVTHILNEEARENIANCGVPKLAVVLFPSLEGSFSWRDDPLTGLMKQIEATISRSGWNIQFPEPGLSFIDTLRGWTEALGGKEKNGDLYIVLDQFDEYFLYHSQEDREGTFAVEFSRAVNSDLQVNFLISIRDDSFAKLDRFKRYIPDLYKHTVCIKHLDWESAYQAIEKPIKIYNKWVSSQESVEIKPTLIESVLEGVSQFVPTESGRAGTEKRESQIETSYLQLVMTCLWERMNQTSRRCLDLDILMDLADQRLKGKKKIQSAIKKICFEHLETALYVLSSREKDIVANIFQYLVTPSGTKYAYSLSDLHTIYVSEDRGELECTKSEFTNLLEKLASGKNRVISPLAPLPNQPAEERRFEISHDALAQPILEWRGRYLARKQRELEHKYSKQLSIRSIKQELAAKSLLYQQRRQDELAALLACQAYYFNQQDQLQVLNRVDDALRQALSVPYFSSILKHHTEAFSSIAFSPNGTKLAAGSWDGNIYLWNQEQSYSEYELLTGHEKGINAIAFSRDGQWLASGSRDQTVRLWDLRQKHPVSKVIGKHKKDVTSIAFSPDGSLLASGSKDRTVKLWNCYQLNRDPIVLAEHSSKDPIGMVRSLTFSPNGSKLAVGCDNGSIWLWDVQEPAQAPDKEPIVRYGHKGKIRSVAFIPDGQLLVSASDDYTIRLWDITQPQEQPEILQDRTHTTKAQVRSVAFSPDGKMLASAGEDQTIRLWKTDQLDEAPQILRGHMFNITSVAFSPDGQYLVSCGWDNTVRLWDLNPPIAKPKILPGHEKTVRAIAISQQDREEQLLASGSEDGTVRVWNLNQPYAERKTFEDCGRVFGVALFVSSDRQTQLLAAGSDDNIVRLWDLQQPSDKPTKQFEGYQDGVSSVAFSPDGRWLASGSWDTTVRLWDLHRPDHEPIIFKGHTDSVTSVKFSSDGKILASASDDNTVLLWNPEQPDADPMPLENHSGRVLSIAFSPDGQYLASASDDWTVRLWKNLDSKNPVDVSLKGHSAWVNSVAFSPDAKVLASGSFDRTIRLWQIDQIDWKARRIYEAPIVLEDHDQSVSSVAFTPDRKYLASGSFDNTVRLWIARTEDLADMVCQKVLHNLTMQEWQQFMGDDIPYEQTCPNLPPGAGTS